MHKRGVSFDYLSCISAVSFENRYLVDLFSHFENSEGPVSLFFLIND